MINKVFTNKPRQYDVTRPPYFVDIPRAGSTALRSMTMHKKKPVKGLLPDCPVSSCGAHATYEEVISTYPDMRELYSVAALRNPWERMLSIYLYNYGSGKKCPRDFTSFVDKAYAGKHTGGVHDGTQTSSSTI